MKHKILILDTDEMYICPEDENLLTAMVRIGRKGIPSGCHGGGCGVCKVEIVNGKCSYGVMSRQHVSKEEEKQGIVLACRAFPRSDVRLRVLGKMRKRFTKDPSPKKFGLV